MTLYRNRDGLDCTRGRLECATGALELETLELPWRDNEANVSCIPAGDYRLELYEPNRRNLGIDHPDHDRPVCLKVLNVRDRSDILAHVANWARELRGCIAVGLTGDPTSVSHSRAALHKLVNAFKGGDTELTIVEAPK